MQMAVFSMIGVGQDQRIQTQTYTKIDSKYIERGFGLFHLWNMAHQALLIK